MDVRVAELLNEALNLDTHGLVVEAYDKYCESLDCLLHSILIPNRPIAIESDARRRPSIQGIRLAQNCIERMSEIAATTTPTETATLTETTNLEDLLAKSDSDLDYLEAIPAASAPPSKHPSARRTSRPNPASRPVARKPDHPVQVDLNLSLVRRMHEDHLIAQSREKAVRAVRLAIPPSNEAVVNDLLRRRQHGQHKLNDLFTAISSKARELQADLKQRIDEEIWKKSLRPLATTSSHLLEPILVLLDRPNHPIADLVRDFVSCERSQLLATLASDDLAALDRAVARCFTETDIFTARLVDLLQHNYDDLAEKSLKLPIELSIECFLFTTPLSALLLHCLRRLHHDRDHTILVKFVTIGWEDLFAKLNIKDLFRLGKKSCDAFPIRAVDPYQSAVEELRAISSESTPLAKMTRLLRTCNLICESVEDFKIKQDQDLSTEALAFKAKSDDYSVGSEDLLGLFSYVLIKAQPAYIYSEFEFISGLLPETMIRGEAGYVLATLQTSLNYIEQTPTVI